MSRVGLYGGSFDPIHRGHVEPVLAAVEELDLERVIYLPTAVPPHKPEVRFAPAARRFAMVEMAVLPHPRLVVSELELGATRTYTIDTVERFRRDHPEDEAHLLIGSDSLAQIESWRRWEELVELAHIVVLRRPGWSPDAVEEALSRAAAEVLAAATVSWVDNEPLDISATEIRRRLRSGEAVPSDWLPEAVVQYATKYGLYS